MSIDPAIPVASFAWDVLKWVVIPIKRQFGYVISSKRYARDIQEEVDNLAYEAERVQNAVREAGDNLRNVYGHVTEWQGRAEKVLKEAEDLLGDFEKASKTCCHGTVPDPSCRYQFSRKAKHMIDDIQELALKGSGFKDLNDISSRPPAPGYVSAPTPARDDGVFESRAQIIRDIMDALASNSVVGVYGMGGVGKSTLLADAERRIREEKSFDLVAKADVSQNPDIKRIQGEIAHALGLRDIKNEDIVSVRAELLRERLKKEEREKKKVLIMLDNLRKGLDLKSVGIPCGHDNKVIGCKLLLTSRNRDVLRREMGCDRDFLLGELQEEEAKELFERIAGEKVHDDEFQPLVDEALHKCAGVPFLIVAMAKRFKNDKIFQWKDALRKMEKFKDKDINELIDHVLRWSYDNLEEEVKALLRLCVVYSVSKPSLENLVRYGVGLGLFQEVSSMEEARDRLRSHICTLQASSLLLDSEDVGGFKIHDLVCEFVALVASRDNPLPVLKDKGKSIAELPKDKLKNGSAICFPYIDMKELPENLDCPELQIFLLFTYSESLHVPNSLFKSMRKLMVLNFTGIRLTPLPSSFQLLEKLHTLCLDGCTLDDVAILGKLKELQILSFAHSKIQRLPKEIGQLIELKLLDLTYCFWLKIIEPGVLGSLTKLEEFYVLDSFDQWNAVEQTPPTNACMIELNRMKNLHTLHMSINDSSVLPEDLNFEKLTKYKIKIGEMKYMPECKGSRTLELNLDQISSFLKKECVQSILGKTDGLYLVELDRMEQSICALSQKGFPKLNYLLVQDSPSVHYILRSTSRTNFITLESLILYNLINLEKICHGHISFKSFSALKVVRVEECDKIEVLFPLSVARELLQLEEIEVVNCKMVQGIVEANDCARFELPKLRILKLHYLPDIKNFVTVRTAPSTSTLDDPVGTQIAFFNEQQVAFPRLEILEITGLDNLEFIFFPSMIKCLTQLRELRVSDCVKMQAIIAEEEGWEIEASETLKFPNLTDLHLQRLESLTCFSREKCSQETQSKDCVKSRSPTLFNQAVVFPSMETLNIFAVGIIEMIWDNEVYFQHLKTLDVSFCDGLSHIFTPTIARNLVELTKLRIINCKMLTEVIVDEGGEDECVVAFKQLKYLELQMLTGLRRFSSGGYTLRFPLLEDVIVTGCLNIRFFSEGPIEAPKLDRLQVTKHEVWFWKENLNFTIQNMFEGMAMVARVEKMRLSEFPELIEKWHSEFIPIKSSWQLQSLVVDKCPSFINAIPSKLMLVLDRMWSLQVRDCESLQEIFDLEGLEGLESTRVLPHLQCLDLVNLPQLMQLCNKDLEGTTHFNSLSSLTLYKCSNLRCAFTPSMARCLANLQRVEIKECGQMEGVIVDEEGQGSVEGKITFPNLKMMELECLPSLTSFLLGKNHALDCSRLERLTIAHCPKMRCLTWQSLMENEHGNPSLFTPQVQIPKLQQMVLSHMDILWKIWTDNPLETLTCKNLREVKVRNCKSLENLFPHWLVTSLDELHKLHVESCGLEEVVTRRDNAPNPTTAQVLFPKLNTLALHDMPQLKSFCPNFPTLSWPSLQELQVTHCDELNMLSFAALMNKWTHKDHEQDLSNQEAHPSFETDFPNLKRLLLVAKDIQMIRDGKFSNDIFPKPEALTLACFHDEKAVFPLKFLLERFQNLNSLEVFCSSFEEIFADEGLVDEGKHAALENLRQLRLSKLHNLKRVWREDYLAMKILRSIETFEVWDCSSLTTLFPTVASFQNLTELAVKDSSGLVQLMTISAVTNLVHLTDITIIGCEKMEEVVTDDGNREEKVISLGRLKKLTLQNMSSLECFSSTTSCILRFPSLEYIKVEECPKMKIFSKGKLSTPELAQVSLFKYVWWYGDWEGDLNATIQRLSA